MAIVPLLPSIRSEEDYRQVYSDTAIWLPAMKAIAARHGLEGSELRRATLGTNVVFRTQRHILKLFSGLWRKDYIAEYEALRHVQGLPTPQIVAVGELEGWPYLVLTVVPGIPAQAVWGHLDQSSQAGIIETLGGMLGQLHAHSPVAALATDWPAFLGDRLATWEDHHQVEGQWRGWIEARVSGFAEPPFSPVLLNADITEDHLLLSERGGRWEVTGLIDFGDAKMGHPYYEFAAPFAFYTFGCPRLSRLLVESYGLSLSAEVMDRMTTYCLLHEYGRLGQFLSRHRVEDGEGFLKGLWGSEVGRG